MRHVWDIDYPDLNWLDNHGRIVIGDTLYQLTMSHAVRTNLKSGNSKTSFPSRIKGSGKTRPLLSEVFPDEIDSRKISEFVVGKDLQTYEVETVITNKSTTELGIRRAVSRTQVKARRIDQTEFSEQALDQVGPIWTKVQMTSRYTILFKGCQTRTNSASANGAEVSISTGRCPESGVTSYHWATALGNSYSLIGSEYLY